MVMVCLMERIKVKTEKGIQELEEFKAYFSSKTYKNYESSNEEEIVTKCMTKILDDIEKFTQNGSGWYFKEVLKLEVNTIKFNPTKGSSYIDLPSWIKNKKAIVNIKNKDDKCFLWCILRYLHPRDRDEERINDLKKYEFSLNTKGITFPIKLNNITQFEKLNPDIPGINVFSEDGYDAHLFIKQLARLEGKINCIPSTEEKYISFSKSIKVDEYYSYKFDKMIDVNFEIRFLDSFKFLQTSLANLVSNLSADDFHNTKHVFKKNVDLLTRKGVYPYDYVSSLDVLSETCLPPKEEFYSKLNDEDTSDDDYKHSIKVWNTFGCNTIRDYHDLYLKSDVLLLSDVFENFRKTCLNHYKLDPVHYYTSPGLAWDACLKETGQHLQLLNDYDTLMMIERGIRGGITHISKRYAEANNKYMEDYNPDVESSFIQYLDANNLYGWAMTQNLPTHGFKWMENITKEKVMDILEKANHSMSNLGSKGYIFEVDLEYPPHLWETHNDYPLAPERMIVNGVEKLICHFKPRKNYVVHYRNLRQYLELGMRITAVHRGISFYQSSWMEPYIRKNTELRKSASNNFEKDFFKLMNNSVFGKTIENIRKRQNIELVNNRERAAKLANRPNFDRCTIFDRNLIAIHMLNTEVYFNKPVYVGQAILDLSKTLMFNFHYTYIREKYGNKAESLFTDTDSLMYQIKTKDFYKDISPDILTKFDTSDYPSNHKSGILTGANKKVIGMFKDEVAGKQITHFKIDFDDYVKCLFSVLNDLIEMERSLGKILGIIDLDNLSLEEREFLANNAKEVDFSKEPVKTEEPKTQEEFYKMLESKAIRKMKENENACRFHNLRKYIQLDTDEYIPMKIYVEVEDPIIGKKVKELVEALEKTRAPEQFYLHKKEADEDAYFAEGYGLTMNEEQKKKFNDFFWGEDVEGLEELLRKEKLYP
ncbi:unnamed protein product [Porites lobata]|uniref:DNA-directed DNA polymerase n=1 Tax=Porites lobata TaxID=104759 RepID=A0ABN8QKU0_9CNID|nr:unnamed protein product [Porites lobata]